MFFEAIYLQNFRNIEALRFEPARGLNIIEGKNGQGKTNLLEAIHLLVTLRSFRQHPMRDLIQIGQEQCGITARFVTDDVKRDIALQLQGSRRLLTVNGNKVQRLQEYFGTMRVVTFTPDDVSVFKDSPAARRMFFDRMIFNLYPAYASEFSQFEKALKQRNSVLKAQNKDENMHQVLEALVAKHGAVIAQRRAAFVEGFLPHLQHTFDEIFGGQISSTLAYDAQYSDETFLMQSLKEHRKRDLLKGYTSVGPQRDDFDAMLDGQLFKSYASQGQHRAFVLACKIAEIRCNVETSGLWPILLMDDVSSELDAQRNAYLFSYLAQLDTQIFLTTTNHKVLQLSRIDALWHMDSGQLKAQG